LSSRNMIEFWERWHISLSQFIRRNIFIPLQMAFMRRSEGRRPLSAAVAAIGISFVLCGLWHGLTVGFLLWGAGQAAGLIVVRLYATFLQRQLGARGVRAYLASPWLRVAAVFLTFEFQAVLQLTLFM
jgi:membrane protein involved in D-alanine export